MSPELKGNLIEKYPKIFERCDSIECDDGWYDLLDTLCNRIQKFIDVDTVYEQVVAVQVKEKYAGLRFYYSGGYTITDGYIGFAEDMSFRICERCGNRGSVRNAGWMKTLCDPCDKAFRKKARDVSVDENEVPARSAPRNK